MVRAQSLKMSRRFLVVTLTLNAWSQAFGFVAGPLVTQKSSFLQQASIVLHADKDDERTLSTTSEDSSIALPPAMTSEASNTTAIGQIQNDPLAGLSTKASMATMISRENKRVLIEELGYRRSDVDRLKFDLAPAIVENRLKCPDSGIPGEWCRSEQDIEQESRMMQQLEQESKYPLKFPLLAISLVLFGKGFGDALITIIKVNIDFLGASLTDEFLGVPVLLIDLVCIVLGSSIGFWTWKTMK